MSSIDRERAAYARMVYDRRPGGRFCPGVKFARLRQHVLRILPWATYEQATDYALARLEDA